MLTGTYEQRQEKGEKCEEGREEKISSIYFSYFPRQWQLQTYWTLKMPLTTPSLASPSPQSPSPWLPGRRERWEKTENRSPFYFYCHHKMPFSQSLPVCMRIDWSVEVLQVVATVMKWKTVTAIFLLVVLYLVMGAAVFKALEQPHER